MWLRMTCKLHANSGWFCKKMAVKRPDRFVCAKRGDFGWAAEQTRWDSQNFFVFASFKQTRSHCLSSPQMKL